MPGSLVCYSSPVAVSAGGSDDPPAEVRLFTPGVNGSTQGEVDFDAESQADVLRAYRVHAVDMMVDLEHASVDKAIREARSDATDAMAHFGLEVREGALWMVGIRWTDEGEGRVRAKKQRYLSPAFRLVPIPGTKRFRVGPLLNVALTSLPASYGAVPLVAASAFSSDSPDTLRRHSMEPGTIQKAIAIIKGKDAKAALALVETMVMEAVSGGAPVPEADAPGEPPAAEALAEPAELPKEDDPAKLSALGAPNLADYQLRQLCLATQSADPAALVVKFSAMQSQLDVALKHEQALVEAERKTLVGQLVTLGAELPVTAWQGDPAAQLPAVRLQSEPIESLRERVAQYSALAPTRAGAIAPPAGDVAMLSAHEQKLTLTMTPDQKAAFADLCLRNRA
jgi:phage I-like protein